ncbi:uncharacterized protein LOC103516995 [Diaphorina citri]|uniref:Uncharacterized protein LOC103516995 n=1 Tax=Diaphorina citri TaxID=121845 RepID=A0A3Q0J972_DIACI|nr:uncharacterized protein LOC103516995 [Diaphorina citri]XP_026685044.1 uncharacterized protein LOC103516995 [Diaphorina citri]
MAAIGIASVHKLMISMCIMLMMMKMTHELQTKDINEIVCYKCDETPHNQENGYLGDFCYIVTRMTPRVSVRSVNCKIVGYDYYYTTLGCCSYGVSTDREKGLVGLVKRFGVQDCLGEYDKYLCHRSDNTTIPGCTVCTKNLCNTFSFYKDNPKKYTRPILHGDPNYNPKYFYTEILESFVNQMLQKVHTSIQWVLRRKLGQRIPKDTPDRRKYEMIAKYYFPGKH